jgi:hypothetical protein
VKTPKFSDLTDKERAWVQSHLEALPLLIEAYSPGDKDKPMSLEVLDRAFASCLTHNIQDVAQVNGTINIFGIRFGQFLVDEAGFRWVIATDGGNSDLAILALRGQGDVLVYPANFVAKRWERRESTFMVEAFDAIRKQVRQIQSASERLHRPWWKFW